MQTKPKSVLIADNFLSAATGYRWMCEDLADQLEKHGLQVIRTSARPGKIARALDMLRTVRRERDRYEAALVGVYSGPSFLWAAAVLTLLRMSGKKSWLHLQGGRFDEFSKKYWDIPIRICGTASLLSSPSQRLAELFSVQLGKTVRTVRNGVPLDISELPPARTAVSEEKLCWLRAFDRTYNPLMAIRAVELLKPQYPRIHLDLCGRVKLRNVFEECRRYIEEHRLQEQVALLPGIPKGEVPAFLARHDLFINTTNYESFGVSVVEAAAAGMVMILTDAGELPHLWQDGRNALIVPRGDADALAQKIRFVLSNPTEAAAIARNARQYACSFAWENRIGEWMDLFQKIADNTNEN